jgi:hypothetical protein
MQKISADANSQSIIVRDITRRCKAAGSELIGIYVVYYPFGSNTTHITVSIRKFIDVLQGSYTQHQSSE